MSWLSIVLQLLTLRRSLQETRSVAESARELAVKGKRAATALVLSLVAALFFFAGLVVAVIELGLQLDRHAAPAYSGLMVSATLLAGIGLALLGAAWFATRERAPPPPPPPPPPSERAERIKDVLEEFLVGFLTQLMKPEPKKD